MFYSFLYLVVLQRRNKIVALNPFIYHKIDNLIRVINLKLYLQHAKKVCSSESKSFAIVHNSCKRKQSMRKASEIINVCKTKQSPGAKQIWINGITSTNRVRTASQFAHSRTRNTKLLGRRSHLRSPYREQSRRNIHASRRAALFEWKLALWTCA